MVKTVRLMSVYGHIVSSSSKHLSYVFNELRWLDNWFNIVMLL